MIYKISNFSNLRAGQTIKRKSNKKIFLKKIRKNPIIVNKMLIIRITLLKNREQNSKRLEEIK